MENIEIDKSQLYINPIAEPLAGDKLERKLLRITKKLIEYKGVKRGVKEVGKCIRKGIKGICIFAADVSPIDVISHLPIQCEEKNIPYVYVRSRLELGLSASTKRPTSVILLTFPPEDSDIYDRFIDLHQRLLQVLKSSN
jgi:H/ACA ribonucleoprotein complex subunit 2